MKNLMKSLAVLTAIFAIAGSALAGECCTKAADKAKQGKDCVKCVKGKCCKAAIEKLGADAKTCTKCAKK
jgi:hypothetical protein